MKKQCNQCLFSENKIVSEERKAQILSECLQNQKFFVCHKSTIEDGNTCCKGFYELIIRSK